MDFAERLFGVAPDGGSGAYELLVVVAPLLVALWWRRIRTLGR